MPLRIAISLGHKEVYASEFTGEMVLGRQQEGEQGPFHRSNKRLVIAPIQERSVSREHIRLEPLGVNQVRIVNLSGRMPIKLNEYDVLPPQESAEVNLPIQVELGTRSVRIASTALSAASHRATSAAPALRSPARVPTVQIRNLQHYFGSGELTKQVLFDNNLDIHEGEIVIMTGPSGSGKTTLLTLIGTLRQVMEGSLQVMGQELLHADNETLVKLRRNMGFIFQAHNLFGSLTARQNVRMALELGAHNDMDSQADEMLSKVGLGERITYRPDSLSGGQKQRVAIARGLVHRPKVILADEPTAALDEKSGRDVVNLFQQMAREDKCTILMVTHDNRILDVADRIVNMVDGRIKSDVAVQESNLICEFLQRSDLFEKLTPQTLADIADKLQVEKASKGKTIVRQGDPGDRLYLVREGTVRVEAIRDGKSQIRAHLTEGDYFGEAALLTGEPRNASVVAVTDTLLYWLQKEDFDEAIASSQTFREQLQKALFTRQ